MRNAALISLLAAFVLSPALAEDEPPVPNEGPWRIILRDQLKNEKACDLNEVLTYQEIPLGTDVGVDGRVSCFDGREFNFTRKAKHQKFSLEVCSPAVC
ncbi:hypothetical protein [Hyphomicrobium sp.]|jgi:hypothetical protein|uniref:hypothetical protein n=1 Tax=Hyphomicrobium sp. TaxID=82 RepID=UPI002FE0062A